MTKFSDRDNEIYVMEA